MATIRFSDNDPLTEFDNVAVPCTNNKNGKDYQADGEALGEVVLAGNPKVFNVGKAAESNVKPLMQYTEDGNYVFTSLTGNADLPEWLQGHDVGYADMIVRNGANGDGLKFRKYTLNYSDTTGRNFETAVRGLLLNGGGEVQGDTQWTSYSHEAGHATNAVSATNADNATKATTAETANNAGYAGNSAMLGGVAADKYALKSEVSSAQGVFDVLYPVSTSEDVTTYIQYPKGLPPQEHFSRMGIVSTWEEITNYDGKFFKINSKKAVGSLTSESLPNIKGKWRRGIQEELTTYNDGDFQEAFYQAGQSIRGPAFGNSSGNYYGTNYLGFDASRSSSVYQDGAKVQPDNVSVKLWKRIA